MGTENVLQSSIFGTYVMHYYIFVGMWLKDPYSPWKLFSIQIYIYFY